MTSLRTIILRDKSDSPTLDLLVSKPLKFYFGYVSFVRFSSGENVEMDEHAIKMTLLSLLASVLSTKVSMAIRNITINNTAKYYPLIAYFSRY